MAEKKTKTVLVPSQMMKNSSEAVKEFGKTLDNTTAELGKKYTDAVKKYIEISGLGTYKEIEVTQEEIQSDNHEAENNKQKLLLLYPEFANHKKILIEYQVMEETESGFNWLYKKVSLAEYFENMDTSNSPDWKIIEPCFSWNGKPCKNLAQSYQNVSPKGSKDYNKIKMFIKK